ncbi:MAG: CapA family protein [Lachnospiraceae bacterium]|nr:CapA family protein [bacterium]MDY5517331.1 CapA family protein [Lachnospiraceae bacterium]
MNKKKKRFLRRTQRVLVILLPILILSLAALLVASRHIRPLQEEPAGDFSVEADLTVPAPADDSNDDDPAAGTEPLDSYLSSPVKVLEEPDTEAVIENDPVTLLFAGDVLLSDYVLNNYNSNGIDGVLSPDLLNELQNADITVINNEFPFSTRGTQAPDKQFTFRVDPKYVSVLTDMGVDIATIANNHVLDYGSDALQDTFDTLDEAGIDYMGAGTDLARASALITKKAGGKTFGFLAASRVIPVVSWDVQNSSPGVFTTYDPSRLIAAIEAARESCDYLTVFVHWGIEREEYPQDYQVSMAKQYIDAGADLVIGSHPHVLQGISYYKDKPVFYSLGNFIFNREIPKTAAVKVTIDGENEPTIRLIAGTASNARTIACEGTQKSDIYDYLESISTGISIDEDGVLSQTAQ